MIYKKAEISLSINAIVILVLAITMVGLGLLFIRDLFQESDICGYTNKDEIIDVAKSNCNNIIENEYSCELTNRYVKFKMNNDSCKQNCIVNTLTLEVTTETLCENKTESKIDSICKNLHKYKGNTMVVYPKLIESRSRLVFAGLDIPDIYGDKAYAYTYDENGVNCLVPAKLCEIYYCTDIELFVPVNYTDYDVWINS